MNVRSDIRQQVMAAIVTVMAEAEATGEDGWRAAERAFPGTPQIVLGEAYAEVTDAGEEAWWRTIERTIDGEIIRNAIAGPASEPIPAGARDAELDEAFASLTTSMECAP